ncbi:hypothetical protein ACE1TF_07640 [Geomicrobium sp. JSM 1781026]
MLNATEKLLFSRELERLRIEADGAPKEYSTYRHYLIKQITLLETVLNNENKG